MSGEMANVRPPGGVIVWWVLGLLRLVFWGNNVFVGPPPPHKIISP
jgi:hypothetical protein